MELMRHSDLRLSSTTYTDTTCLPLFAEVEKLDSFLPSPIASPKSDKLSQKEEKPVQSGLVDAIAEVRVFQRETGSLSNAVPSWENLRLFVKDWGHGALDEPPCPL